MAYPRLIAVRKCLNHLLIEDEQHYLRHPYATEGLLDHTRCGGEIRLHR